MKDKEDCTDCIGSVICHKENVDGVSIHSDGVNDLARTGPLPDQTKKKVSDSSDNHNQPDLD